MLSFKNASRKRRSRSYADLPINIANRKLPALPIHKRKLPALPQSATIFKEEPIEEQGSATVELPKKVSLESKHSAPSGFGNYFKKKKAQKKGASHKLYKPKSVPLKTTATRRRAQSDDGKSIKDIFINMVQTMGGSKRGLASPQRPKSARNLHHNKHTFKPIQPPKSKWKPSLEFINNDSELLNELIAHCTRQCCEENIEFLHVVYDLNKRITRLLLSYDVTTVKEEAINIEIVSIYSTFIFKEADKQLNLSHDTFARAMEDYDIFRQCSLNQKSMIFDECCIEIERLMKKSVLTQFYQSDTFQSIARARGIMENKKYVEPANYLGGFGCVDMLSGSEEAEEGYFSDSAHSNISNYSNLTYSSYGDKNHDVHFDTYSSVQWNDHNKWKVSSKGMSEGCHEWKIEIVKCNNERQEFGIISNFDEDMEMNEYGICETPEMSSRAVYGFNKLVKMDKNKKVIGCENHFYYASYRADNTVRCDKDLSKLSVHENGWKEGDVIRISLNMDKGFIRFYLNDKRVRKQVSVDKNATFYPIILYSGNCEYRLID